MAKPLTKENIALGMLISFFEEGHQERTVGTVTDIYHDDADGDITVTLRFDDGSEIHFPLIEHLIKRDALIVG